MVIVVIVVINDEIGNGVVTPTNAQRIGTHMLLLPLLPLLPLLHECSKMFL